MGLQSLDRAGYEIGDDCCLDYGQGEGCGDGGRRRRRPDRRQSWQPTQPTTGSPDLDRLTKTQKVDERKKEITKRRRLLPVN